LAISHALAKKNYKAPDTEDQFGHFEDLQDINIFLDTGAYHFKKPIPYIRKFDKRKI